MGFWGSGRDLIEKISRYLCKGTEKTKTLSQNSLDPNSTNLERYHCTNLLRTPCYLPKQSILWASYSSSGIFCSSNRRNRLPQERSGELVAFPSALNLSWRKQIWFNRDFCSIILFLTLQHTDLSIRTLGTRKIVIDEAHYVSSGGSTSLQKFTFCKLKLISAAILFTSEPFYGVI
jgi:hypothetical protein